MVGSCRLVSVLRSGCGVALAAGVLSAHGLGTDSAVPAGHGATLDWQRIGETASATIYVEAGSLRRDGQIRRIVELQNLKAPDPEGVRSRRYEAEYECRYRMVRIGHVGSFTGAWLSGVKVFDVREIGYWRRVLPNSPFGLMLALVCADYNGPSG